MSHNTNFLDKVKEAAAGNCQLTHDKPIIVALSGGADSVALLSSLQKLGYDCIAAHCNYHLRGAESNRDMQHAQAICAALGVDLYVRDFDVEARRRLTGESVEMACRELRYGWFNNLLDRQRAQAIAVAHHREDNIETFFLNLMRGSSIAGLTGMRWRNGYVVRPLLALSRQEVEAYLAEQGLEYVVDSSNRENTYSRNRLRNIVLPSLEEQFPGAFDGILSSIELLGRNREFYESQMQSKREQYIVDNAINLRELAREPQAALVLYELLKPLGFNATHVDNILVSAARSGLSFTAGATTLELDRGMLHINSASSSGHQGETSISLHRDVLSPIHVLVSEHRIEEFKPERDPNIAFFDLSMLSGEPSLALRHWQKGDRMAPFGLNGTRLVSDMLAGAKYSAAQKRGAWLLTRNGEILWIVGLRSSSRFCITPETKRFLRLQYRP